MRLTILEAAALRAIVDNDGLTPEAMIAGGFSGDAVFCLVNQTPYAMDNCGTIPETPAGRKEVKPHE